MNTTAKDKTYIAYCRINNPKQREKLATQKKLISEYARNKDMKIQECDYFIDNGADNERKVFLAMLKRLNESDVSGFICSRVDRFSRYTKDFKRLSKPFNKGKKMLIVDQNAEVGYSYKIFSEMSEKYKNVLKF